MKFASKKFLIILFVCCSQTIICMKSTEQLRMQFTKELQEAPLKIALEVINQHNRDSSNSFLEFAIEKQDQAKIVEDIEKTLKKQRQEFIHSIEKKCNLSGSAQKPFTIAYDNHIPPHFPRMLQKTL